MLVTGPTAEPIDLLEAKAHLRVTSTDEDALIQALIAATREHVETWTRRALIRQTRSHRLDRFPAGDIVLPVSPLRSVDGITYVDTAGVTQTLDPSRYQVAAGEPPRIRPAYGQTWPASLSVLDAVTVIYTVGHAVPFTADANTDTLTAQGHGLSDGDTVQLYNSGGKLPAGLDASTTYYVVNAATDTLQLATIAGGAAVDITDTGSGIHYLGVVPTPIRQAMLLMVGHLYENREASTVGPAITELPMGVEALLAPYRVLRF